jgi:hypothetical protein
MKKKADGTYELITRTPDLYTENGKEADWTNTKKATSDSRRVSWEHLDNLGEGETYVIVETDVDGATNVVKDARSGAFNPLLAVYKEGALTKEQKDELFRALLLELSDAEAALDLTESSCPDAEAAAITDAIIKNILYLGMPNVQRSVIYKDEDTASSERQSK